MAVASLEVPPSVPRSTIDVLADAGGATSAAIAAAMNVVRIRRFMRLTSRRAPIGEQVLAQEGPYDWGTAERLRQANPGWFSDDLAFNGPPVGFWRQVAVLWVGASRWRGRR